MLGGLNQFDARATIAQKPKQKTFKTKWIESRWHRPQEVVYMDPHLKDILGSVPSTVFFETTVRS